MFTFSELLNQWMAENSSSLINKENYLRFKENIELFYELAFNYYHIKEEKKGKNEYFDMEINALYELIVSYTFYLFLIESWKKI